jgi:hypothetical protein
MRTVKSPEPEASIVPSGLNATEWTYDEWPRSSIVSSKVSVCQTWTMLSLQPVAQTRGASSAPVSVSHT